MADAVTCRFEEWHRYEVNEDAEVVMLQAVTGKETVFAQFPKSTFSDLRQKRQDFRDYVLDCIDRDVAPHEVGFDG